MHLTPRDLDVVLAVHEHRLLRRDQIERLLFPSKNTANERLKRLHQHGYLARRRLPVEIGQGSSQALYLLASRGAQLVAAHLGVDVAAIGWRRAHNHASALFLEHTLMVNEARLALALAARRHGYTLERWMAEEQLKRAPDRVTIVEGRHASREMAFIPDGYFTLHMAARRASFFLEVDRATESNRRWAQKVLAYLAYVRSGAYRQRYHTDCLRVLTVTTSAKRLHNLLLTTEKAGGGAMFWFTSLEQLSPETVLHAPIWQVPHQHDPAPLLDTEPIPSLVSSLRSAAVVLYRS
jgi:hypothetical protein